MLSRGYDVYRPQALRSLKTRLGEMDAALEWLEVGIRRLDRLNTRGRRAALQRAANAEGIRVTEFDATHIRRSWARLQVVAIHAYVETFLVELLRERGHNKSGIDEGESLLEYVGRTLNVRLTDEAQLYGDILEFYRIVRNIALHKSGPRLKLVRASTLRAKLAKTAYCKLNAPNEHDQLSFDDFVLFTRAAKDFAIAITSAAAPDQAFVLSRLNKPEASKILHSLRRESRVDRRRQLLGNYLEREQGLVRATESFLDDILACLLAQRQSSPSKTDRD